VTTAGSGFEIDGALPQSSVAPADEAALARVLFEAQRAGVSVCAVGAARHLHIGNIPASYDVAVSTARLRKTLEHEPDDLTATADAGVRIGDLQSALATRGQWLPIDAPAEATVGGVLAVNASGPLRHAYGTLRDWLIGLRVAHVDGSISKSGGRVVKNVAGYDMHKLHIGALGTLGMITQATFKLATMPPACATLRAWFGDAAPACALVLAARDRGLPLIVGEVLSPDAHAGTAWCVVLRAAGSGAAVERTMREVQSLAEKHGGKGHARSDETVDAPVRSAPARRLIGLRIGGPPAEVESTIARLRVVEPAIDVAATVAAGVVRCAADKQSDDARSLLDRATDIVNRVGGSLFIEAAPIELKRETDVFGAPRPDWAIMRRLKQEFDPSATLAPGRFAGRI
jgi:glycolate oxidase FAD binding subunit